MPECATAHAAAINVWWAFVVISATAWHSTPEITCVFQGTLLFRSAWNTDSFSDSWFNEDWACDGPWQIEMNSTRYTWTVIVTIGILGSRLLITEGPHPVGIISTPF